MLVSVISLLSFLRVKYFNSTVCTIGVPDACKTIRILEKEEVSHVHFWFTWPTSLFMLMMHMFLSCSLHNIFFLFQL